MRRLIILAALAVITRSAMGAFENKNISCQIVFKKVNQATCINSNLETYSSFARAKSLDLEEKSLSENVTSLLLVSRLMFFIPLDTLKLFANITEFGIVTPMAQITTIDRINFQSSAKLKKIFIVGQRIKSLGPNIFMGAEAVTNLFLQSNQIETIREETFNGLTSCKYLVLSNNQISSLESETFSPMPNLWAVSLKRNKLKSLKETIFTNIRLAILDLSYNSLKSLPQQVVDNFIESTDEMKVLAVMGNQCNNRIYTKDSSAVEKSLRECILGRGSVEGNLETRLAREIVKMRENISNLEKENKRLTTENEELTKASKTRRMGEDCDVAHCRKFLGEESKEQREMINKVLPHLIKMSEHNKKLSGTLLEMKNHHPTDHCNVENKHELPTHNLTSVEHELNENVKTTNEFRGIDKKLVVYIDSLITFINKRLQGGDNNIDELIFLSNETSAKAAACMAEVVILNERIHSLENETEFLKVAHDAYKNQVSELEDGISFWEHEFHDCVEEAENQTLQIAKLQIDYQECVNASEILESDNQNYNKSVRDLTTEVTELSEKLSFVEIEYKDCVDEAENLENFHLNCSSQVSELEDKLWLMEDEHKDCSSTTTKLAEGMRILQREVVGVRMREKEFAKCKAIRHIFAVYEQKTDELDVTKQGMNFEIDHLYETLKMFSVNDEVSSKYHGIWYVQQNVDPQAKVRSNMVLEIMDDLNSFYETLTQEQLDVVRQIKKITESLHNPLRKTADSNEKTELNLKLLEDIEGLKQKGRTQKEIVNVEDQQIKKKITAALPELEGSQISNVLQRLQEKISLKHDLLLQKYSEIEKLADNLKQIPGLMTVSQIIDEQKKSKHELDEAIAVKSVEIEKHLVTLHNLTYYEQMWDGMWWIQQFIDSIGKERSNDIDEIQTELVTFYESLAPGDSNIDEMVKLLGASNEDNEPVEPRANIFNDLTTLREAVAGQIKIVDMEEAIVKRKLLEVQPLLDSSDASEALKTLETAITDKQALLLRKYTDLEKFVDGLQKVLEGDSEDHDRFEFKTIEDMIRFVDENADLQIEMNVSCSSEEFGSSHTCAAELSELRDRLVLLKSENDGLSQMVDVCKKNPKCAEVYDVLVHLNDEIVNKEEKSGKLVQGMKLLLQETIEAEEKVREKALENLELQEEVADFKAMEQISEYESFKTDTDEAIAQQNLKVDEAFEELHKLVRKGKSLRKQFSDPFAKASKNADMTLEIIDDIKGFWSFIFNDEVNLMSGIKKLSKPRQLVLEKVHEREELNSQILYDVGKLKKTVKKQKENLNIGEDRIKQKISDFIETLDTSENQYSQEISSLVKKLDGLISVKDALILQEYNGMEKVLSKLADARKSALNASKQLAVQSDDSDIPLLETVEEMLHFMDEKIHHKKAATINKRINVDLDFANACRPEQTERLIALEGENGALKQLVEKCPKSKDLEEIKKSFVHLNQEIVKKSHTVEQLSKKLETLQQNNNEILDDEKIYSQEISKLKADVIDCQTINRMESVKKRLHQTDEQLGKIDAILEEVFDDWDNIFFKEIETLPMVGSDVKIDVVEELKLLYENADRGIAAIDSKIQEIHNELVHSKNRLSADSENTNDEIIDELKSLKETIIAKRNELQSAQEIKRKMMKVARHLNGSDSEVREWFERLDKTAAEKYVLLLKKYDDIENFSEEMELLRKEIRSENQLSLETPVHKFGGLSDTNQFVDDQSPDDITHISMRDLGEISDFAEQKAPKEQDLKVMITKLEASNRACTMKSNFKCNNTEQCQEIDDMLTDLNFRLLKKEQLVAELTKGINLLKADFLELEETKELESYDLKENMADCTTFRQIEGIKKIVLASDVEFSKKMYDVKTIMASMQPAPRNKKSRNLRKSQASADFSQGSKEAMATQKKSAFNEDLRLPLNSAVFPHKSKESEAPHKSTFDEDLRLPLNSAVFPHKPKELEATHKSFAFDADLRLPLNGADSPHKSKEDHETHHLFAFDEDRHAHKTHKTLDKDFRLPVSSADFPHKAAEAGATHDLQMPEKADAAQKSLDENLEENNEEEIVLTPMLGIGRSIGRLTLLYDSFKSGNVLINSKLDEITKLLERPSGATESLEVTERLKINRQVLEMIEKLNTIIDEDKQRLEKVDSEVKEAIASNLEKLDSSTRRNVDATSAHLINLNGAFNDIDEMMRAKYERIRVLTEEMENSRHDAIEAGLALVAEMDDESIHQFDELDSLVDFVNDVNQPTFLDDSEVMQSTLGQQLGRISELKSDGETCKKTSEEQKKKYDELKRKCEKCRGTWSKVSGTISSWFGQTKSECDF